MWPVLVREAAAVWQTLPRWSLIMSEQHRPGWLCSSARALWPESAENSTPGFSCCSAWLCPRCVLLKGKWWPRVCASPPNTNYPDLNKVPSTAASTRREFFQPALGCRKKRTPFFKTQSLTCTPPTRAARRHTHQAEAAARRCVLCNSGVKWTHNTHQTFATSEAASSEQLGAGWATQEGQRRQRCVRIGTCISHHLSSYGTFLIKGKRLRVLLLNETAV